MRWPGIEALYGQDLRRTRVFGLKGTEGVTGDIDELSDGDSKGEQRWQVLHDRVVEHVRPPFFFLPLPLPLCPPNHATNPPALPPLQQNIRTISKYYTRISTSRLSELLDLTLPETEGFLSKLVGTKTVYAKIDRPAGIVSFQAPKGGDAILNEWSSDVGKLMGLIEKSCHLIAKVRFSPSFLPPPPPLGFKVI